MGDDRLMLLAISESSFLACLRGDLRAHLDLPSDVQIREVFHEPARRAFIAVLVSASFAPVPQCERIPELPPFAVERIRS